MINSFFINLWDFGITRIIKSWDFLFSIFLCVTFWYLKKYQSVEVEINYEIIMSVLVSLFTFVFAALAIVISLSDEKFLKLLKQQKVLHKLLFHYWYACVIYLLFTFVVFLLKMLKIENSFKFIGIFCFFYAIFLTVELVKTTISFGYYREKLLEL